MEMLTVTDGRAAQPARSARGGTNAARRREAIAGYGFVLPFLALLSVFYLYVFVSGFRTSLTDAQGINPGDFIGFANYRQLLWADEFRRAEFWRAVRTTAYYTLGCLATQVPAAFVLATVLNALPFRKTRAALRAAFFLPVLLNTVTTALLFRMFFNKDQGIVNHLLAALGARGDIDWLMNSRWSIPLMVAVSFWQWTGFHMVYFLAQLQTVDPSLYEAARMEGATPLDTLLRITMPLMRPAFTFVLVTSAIGCIQLFDLVFILFLNASYGPGGSAKTLVAYIYDEGFSQQFLTGLASAIGWLTFLIIAGVSALQLRVLGLGRAGDA